MSRSFLPLIALLVASCEELPADPTRFYADLEVLVATDDQPVEGMEVALTLGGRDRTAAYHSRAETSGSGVARFEDVPPGFYTLESRHGEDEVVCNSANFWVHPSNPWVPYTPRREATVAHVKYAMLVLPGFLEFEPDTVRLNVGDTLRTTTTVRGELPEMEPDPRPGTVFAPYYSFRPEALRCTDVPREIVVLPRPCETVARRESSRPDAPPLRVIESMMETIVRFFPCALGPDGEPLGLEAWTSQGSGCEAWSRYINVSWSGLKLLSFSTFVAEECGWARVSIFEWDAQKRMWREPFDGVATLRVEIVGC